ncbi:ATP-grasp fold amidoligase family protein [Edwardsiella tarda]|uniref:ATP-grasp fold amidoligase family protein n=1 Tax=Edwardsiella tarda TaxID=636 RepID=UPI0034DCFF0B
MKTKKVLNLLPDSLFLRLRYYKRFNRILSLKEPQRFTEKMMWYKLYYRNDLMTLCADKYQVRKYIKDKGYDDILVPLLRVYDDATQIRLDELPDKFILKGNNGSETNLVVKNKNDISEQDLIEIVSRWKDNNQAISMGREWCYKNIKFKITAEELLEVNGCDGIDDYKFLCFNGKVHYIWVDKDRFSNHSRTFFDREWNRILVESDHPVSDEEIECPWGFDRMLEISESIGKDFPFARVDFYSVNKKIYFGEITFYPWSGMVEFKPDSFDFEMGRLLEFPKGIDE